MHGNRQHFLFFFNSMGSVRKTQNKEITRTLKDHAPIYHVNHVVIKIRWTKTPNASSPKSPNNAR